MIICSKCAKENQDHYKFCLGCGAELPKDKAPKPFKADTPPQGTKAASAPAIAKATEPKPAAAPVQPAAVQAPVVQAPVVQPPAVQPPAPFAAGQGSAAPAFAEPAALKVEAAAVASGIKPAAGVPRPGASSPPVAEPALEVAPEPVAPVGVDRSCPQCGHGNPGNNRFCAACGYNLGSVAAAPIAAPAAAASAGANVVLTALRADGSEAGSYRLPSGPTTTVGRDTDSVFAGDSYLSPKHATFTQTAEGVSVQDAGSLNGVYVKLRANEPWPLAPGSVFRIGQEIIRFESLEREPASGDGVEKLGSPSRGFIGRLALVIGRDTTGNAFPIPERGLHLGRERGDVLFSEDGYVSGLHCRVAPGSDGRVYLTDVGSSNGTFVRLYGEQTLASGEILLMGQQVFRVDF